MLSRVRGSGVSAIAYAHKRTDRQGKVLPLHQPLGQELPPLVSYLVIPPGTAFGGTLLPALHQPLDFQALEGGVDSAPLELEIAGSPFLQFLDDVIAVGLHLVD